MSRPDSRPSIVYAGPLPDRDPVRVIDGIQLEAWGDRVVHLHIYAPIALDVSASAPWDCVRTTIPELTPGRVLVVARSATEPGYRATAVVVDLPEGWRVFGAVPSGVLFAWGLGDVYQQADLWRTP